MDSASSRNSHEVQRLAAQINEDLRQERLRAQADCAAAVERCQNEAQIRLDSVDSWRATFEQREVVSNDRLMSHERRHSQQEQRLASHDELLQKLAELPQRLEARVEEARNTAKEDLMATTRIAFQ